jgi:hypothetical protein
VAFSTSNYVTFGQVTASNMQVTNLNVVNITSSTEYASGSNVFGNNITNTQTMTGSVLVTGSMTVAGPASASSFSGPVTGGLLGIASTASYYQVTYPTNQSYYGATSTSSVSGILYGDRDEDALNKIELILELLAPSKPPNLSTITLNMLNAYTAISASSATSYSTVYYGASPVFSASGVFGDGNAGSLTSSLDGVNVGSTAISGSPTSNVGTYGDLQITNNNDYWSGSAGKSGFWRQLMAQINATGQTTIGPHSASLTHSTTGTTPNYIYYIDDAPTPTSVSGTASGSGATYISGVPALVGGVSSSAITFSATASNAVSRFYNSTRVFAVSGTGINASNFTLPTNPVSGSVQSGSKSVSVNAGSTGENNTFTITAYNSRGITATGTISNTYLRMDSTLDTANRVPSSTGQYPTSASAYDSGSWNASQNLASAGQEELQMLNGQYQYPTGNYTGSSPIAGPNYSSLPGVTFGTVRWVTFSLGAQSAIQNVTLTFNNTSNMGSSAIISPGWYLYVKVDGVTGWVDGNAAYPAVGSPVNNGDAALVIASSTGTTKVVTFGTTPRTGNVFVRVGISSGQTYKFGSITAAYS